MTLVTVSRKENLPKLSNLPQSKIFLRINMTYTCRCSGETDNDKREIKHSQPYIRVIEQIVNHTNRNKAMKMATTPLTPVQWPYD